MTPKLDYPPQSPVGKCRSAAPASLTFLPSVSSADRPWVKADPEWVKCSARRTSAGPGLASARRVKTHYLPSVAYKVGVVVLQETEPMSIGKPIAERDNRLTPSQINPLFVDFVLP